MRVSSKGEVDGHDKLDETHGKGKGKGMEEKENMEERETREAKTFSRTRR